MVDMDSAPQDMLVEVFRRLAPRSLASCRCVCRAWHAIVDANRLLRADLLPLTLDGVFFETSMFSTSKLFSRRSTGRKVTSRLDYLDCPLARGDLYWPIMDCCNGLLVLADSDHVVNPATRQWVRFPPPPPSCIATDCHKCFDYRYLVYDPTVSPHYEVFSVPLIPFNLRTGHVCRHICDDQLVSAMEWPPSPYIMHVFSSKTGLWKEKSFIRQGDSAGTIAEVRWAYEPFYSAAYWKGALYVHCEKDSVFRINLLHDKYQVIKLPKGKEGYHKVRIGKSKNGVYSVFREGLCTFQVWFLDESHGQTEWVLKSDINLQPAEKNYPWNELDDGPWSLQSDDQREWVLKNDVNLEPVDDIRGAIVEDNFEWDTDNEYIVGTTDWEKNEFPTYFHCLGFHPYKEILLFHGSLRTVACYFDSLKFRDLGKMDYGFGEIRESFPYASCWMRNLPGSN